MEPSDVQTLMTDGGRGWCDIVAPVAIAGHHSVTFLWPPTTAQAELDHLRMIDVYHASQGWGGFGYHLAAFASGRLYLCGDVRRCRAHVKARNHELVGIVAVGDFRTAPPGEAQLRAFWSGVAYIRRRLSRPLLPIGSHRGLALAAFPTACPGVWPWPNVEEDDMNEAETTALFQRLHAAAHGSTPVGTTHTCGPEAARGLWGVWEARRKPLPWGTWHPQTNALNGWAAGASPVLHVGQVIRVAA
jgi:hypothetical protein